MALADLVLEDALYGEDAAEELEPGWVPGDRDQVNRVLGRYARVRRDLEADRAQAEAEVERIAGWLAAREDRHERELARLTELLEHYHAAVLAADPRLKTIDLPNGVLKARVGTKPRIEFTSPDDVLGWAQVHRPELVRETTAVSVDQDLARKVLEVVATDAGYAVVDPKLGEFVPGVVAHGPSTTYSIDVERAG